MWWLAFTLAAFAQEKIDLSPHYVPKVQKDLSYEIVERNGIRYKKFGSFYVIDGQPLSKGTIESGECFEQGGALTHEDLIKGETRLPSTDVKAFAALIQETSLNRCDNFHVATTTPPMLGIGLSKTVTGKDGTKREYRLFNADFGPNLNISGQF